MYILGINCYNAHDSSACIIKDGRLIAFAEEERFNRKKHTNVYPYNAVEYCLTEARLPRDEKIIVGFYWKPFLEVTGNLFHLLRYFPMSLNLLRANPSRVNFIQNFLQQLTLPSRIKRLHRLRNIKFYYIEHHLAHAASAFFLSGFEDAAILTLDSRGERCSGILAEGKGTNIRKISEFNVLTQSLGNLYAAFTAFLGFKVNNDEFKVMGLSAYGRPAYNAEFEKIVKLLPDGNFKLDLSYFSYHIYGQRRWYSKKCADVFGVPRKYGGPVEKRHEDIAYGVQHILEKTAMHIVNGLHSKVPSRNLCLAGGVALNCLMNTKIFEEAPFKNIFVQPAAYDAGCSVGAAYYIYHELFKHKREFQLEHVYWGPQFSNSEIESVFKKRRLNYQYTKDIPTVAAEKISEGKILGWFQGRMEAGPRALGNRSIIVDPRRPEMKDILNKRIKRRESFRPFAPSVLRERYKDYFDLGIESPFMLFTARVKKERQREIPAVTHVDGTARIQTVDRSTNPKFWQLIKSFEEITGTPVVLNTSFNENEPIVCTPQDAIDCFLRTQMDVLCLGDFIVEKDSK